MKELTIKSVKEELCKRGFRNITKEDINHWAIILTLEKLVKK